MRMDNALSEPAKPGYHRLDVAGKAVRIMDNRNQFIGAGLALGMVIGLFIGLALNQIALGIPIGVALGAGLGIVLAQTMDRFG